MFMLPDDFINYNCLNSYATNPTVSPQLKLAVLHIDLRLRR